MRRSSRWWRCAPLALAFTMALVRASAQEAEPATPAQSPESYATTEPRPLALLPPAGQEQPEPAAGGSQADSWRSDLWREIDSYSKTEPGKEPSQTDASASSKDGNAVSAFLRTYVWLLVVLAAILVLYYLVRRFGKRSPLLAGMDLGQVIGRVYLNPRASLHFVRVRGRVLVVGVTPNAMSRVAEFDADDFDSAAARPSKPGADKTGAFLAQLQAKMQSFAERRDHTPESAPPATDTPAGHQPEPVQPANTVAAQNSGASGNGKEDADEIAVLRQSIQRLQEQIQDTYRELGT